MSTPEYLKHPRYLADGGGLFGAPPSLKCQYCSKSTWELFYGHCRKCAEEKDVPMRMAEPEAFHEAFNSGTTAVVDADNLKLSWWQRVLYRIKSLFK